MGEKLLERFATRLIEFPDSPRTGKARAQETKTTEKILIAFRKIITNHIITNCDKEVKLVHGHFLSLYPSPSSSSRPPPNSLWSKTNWDS